MARDPESEVRSFPEVLTEELALLRPRWRASLAAAGEDGASPALRLRRLYELLGKPPADERALTALCLSGGGMRSATFNLGVLQAFARRRLLHQFDYLSTVSGGGYIASWLEAWIAQQRRSEPGYDPVREVERVLWRHPVHDEADADAPVPPAEPRPVRQLRDFSNFLTPRRGLFSGDTWSLVANIVRNLLLNWLVAVPVIAAVVMVPQAAHLAVALAHADGGNHAALGQGLVYVAFALGLVASITANLARCEKRGPPPGPGDGEREQRRRIRVWRRNFVLGSAGLVIASAMALVLGALLLEDPWLAIPGLGLSSPPSSLWRLALRACPWVIGISVLGRAIALALRGERPDLGVLPIELLGLVAAGAACAFVLAWLSDAPWAWLRTRPLPATILAVPALLGVYVLGRALYTGVTGIADDRPLADARDEAARNRRIGDDADREWSARLGGRILEAGTLWLAGSALVLLAGAWLSWLEWAIGQAQAWVASTGVAGALGTITALLGKSGTTSSGRGAPRPSSRTQELALRVAAPAAVALTLVLLSRLTWTGAATFSPVPPLLSYFSSSCGGPGPCTVHGVELLVLLGVALALALAGGLAGLFVNINRFSLHELYRMRLVRAYLGASNRARRPNPNTGFDPTDSRLRLADLVPPAPAPGEPPRPVCLFPILNAALNLVAGDQLAWQQRKAEAFSMTPLHCGSVREGYRPTRRYGSPHDGLSLGTAMAISGAAANPNMGHLSSPPLAFLLALLNARLGVWLPNPGAAGGRNTARRGPLFATGHMLRELLGLTTAEGRYVNLTDGGHFDNLGLYEVVLRRCRLVVVSDAACDGRYAFGDLGNAIRKIRVDLGISIEFEHDVRIEGRPDGAGGERSCYAVGTIRYDEVDGPSAPPGRLVYLKPTLAPGDRAPVPMDVRAYSGQSAAFPQESTADQWFSESQFESYRELGFHMAARLLDECPVKKLGELIPRSVEIHFPAAPELLVTH